MSADNHTKRSENVMKKYRILLMMSENGAYLEGSEKFYIEAADEDAAWAKGEQMVEAGTWSDEFDGRLRYYVCDVSAEPPEAAANKDKEID